MHFRALMIGLVVGLTLPESEAGELLSDKLLSDKVKRFELKPQVCIVKKIGDSCRLETGVEWQTREKMDVCLTHEGKTLRCWQGQQQAKTALAIMLSQNSQVWLLDGDNEKLATATLTVNAVTPKKRRRRLRSPWSLF